MCMLLENVVQSFIRSDFSAPIAHVIIRNESATIVNVLLTAVQVEIANGLESGIRNQESGIFYSK